MSGNVDPQYLPWAWVLDKAEPMQCLLNSYPGSAPEPIQVLHPPAPPAMELRWRRLTSPQIGPLDPKNLKLYLQFAVMSP